MCFVDDLLLFARGDTKSVELLMEAYNTFSKSAGLKVNPIKCSVYFSAVGENVKREILEKTSFKEGSLPFRYLGEPMTGKN